MAVAFGLGCGGSGDESGGVSPAGVSQPRGEDAGAGADAHAGFDGDEDDASANDDAGMDASPTLHTIGGVVAGLHGSGLTLRLNGGDDLAITQDGSFVFPSGLAEGAPYQVTVASQPTAPPQTCTVLLGAGTVPDADVANVGITCVDDLFPVEVDVTGLVAGTTLVLQNGGGDDLTVTMPGKVAFTTPLAYGATYDVTIKTQPAGAPPKICAVTNGAGTIGASAALVTVDCTGWTAHRTIALFNEHAAELASEQVLVVLDSAFSYAKTKPNGADLRFSTTSSFADSLPYFIESWEPSGASLVWVKVPSVPVGPSSIHMFYDQPRAAPVADFASTFPNVWVSPGTGWKGTIVPSVVSVDWFELKSGDSCDVQTDMAHEIRAKRIIINGVINARASGYSWNVTKNPPRAGGTPSDLFVSPAPWGGGGGGGSFGAGGAGGHADGAPIGEGGSSFADVDMGSPGGGPDLGHCGIGGGGGVILRGTSVDLHGRVDLHSFDFQPGLGCGGGSGGSLVVKGMRIHASGATVNAYGADGSPASGSLNGGGGGAGGRIELLARSSVVGVDTWNVQGGKGGGALPGTIPAEDGGSGSYFATASATAVEAPIVRVDVSPEQ